MELWIRSQDKEKLVKCNDITIATDTEDEKTIRGYKYVRTKEGYICKILKLNEPKYDDGYLDFNDIDSPRIYKPNVVKSSPNIIDLIKKKDIVIDYKGNIYQVVKVWKGYVFTDMKNEYGQVITLVDYQIKSIVTKEQFEQMKYKIT